jgi:hypothetical protein
MKSLRPGDLERGGSPAPTRAENARALSLSKVTGPGFPLSVALFPEYLTFGQAEIKTSEHSSDGTEKQKPTLIG